MPATNQKNMRKICFLLIAITIFGGCAIDPPELNENENQDDKETVSPDENIKDVKDIEDEATKEKISEPIVEPNASNDLWTFTGDPNRHDNQSYEGPVTLKGWMVDHERYIGDPVPHFYVSDESIAKLPPTFTPVEKPYQRYLYLGTAEDRPLVKSLIENYSEENPATISLSKIVISMEGTPMATIASIMKSY